LHAQEDPINVTAASGARPFAPPPVSDPTVAYSISFEQPGRLDLMRNSDRWDDGHAPHVCIDVQHRQRQPNAPLRTSTWLDAQRISARQPVFVAQDYFMNMTTGMETCSKRTDIVQFVTNHDILSKIFTILCRNLLTINISFRNQTFSKLARYMRIGHGRQDIIASKFRDWRYRLKRSRRATV